MTRKTRHLIFFLLLLGLSSCVPWTVRPISSTNATPEESSVTFSAVTYVDAIWPSKLPTVILSSAVDARELLPALRTSPAKAISDFGVRHPNGPAYFVVKGEGKVTAVNTRSRVGLALVDVEPYDGKADVSIQVGPVIRGTSLRDATGIIPFSDFLNQLQYADVGNELNSRVLASLLSSLNVSLLEGKHISFAGTLAAQEASTPPLSELVPITLSVTEGH